jgi:hypothetical protein
VITLPSGTTTRSTTRIRLNHYYSAALTKVMSGRTTVTFTVGNAKKVVVNVHGHPGPAPAVTALSSHAGPVGGGNTVTVTGANFAKVTKVLFGSVAGTRLKVKSATRLTIRVPAGTRARFVTVVTASGGPSALTGRAVYNYLPAPVLTGLTPASGPAAGGTTVIISGRGYAYVKAVHFGSRLGTHLVVISARKIKVVAPAGSGTVNVKVSTAGGTSANVASGKYAYT